jgi:dipeptidyl aminopeptidase/acylaminoacyl peptidase
MRITPRRVLFLVPLVGATLTLSAQTPKLLDKDTYMEMEAVSNPAISPDGSRVVFAREWIDQTKDQRRSNLWVARTDGSRVRELTAGAWRDSVPVWSPDSARIAFLSDRDGTTQLHVVFADTGEIAQLTHVQHPPAALRWSPDGKQIAFTSPIPDEDPILRVELPKRPRGAEWAKGATIVDRLSWQRDGVGPVEKSYTHVFVVDATIGGTPRQLTTGKYNHVDPEWSADGRTLYISGTRKPDAEYLRNDTEIYAIDVASGSIKALTDRKGPDANPTVSPDGRLIAYTGYDDKNETSTLSNLYLMDGDGGAKRLWRGGLSESPANLAWAHDGSGVYFTVGEKGSTSVYFSPLHGELRKLTDGVQELTGFSIAHTGQAAVVRSTPTRPGYLVTFPIASAPNAASWNTLVDVNDDVVGGVTLSDAEELWYPSKDGLKVQGWLIKPAGFQAGRKYPLVLFIHGGPWSMYNVGFSWSFQNLAANGYAVLYVNPRGSTGYGQDFVNGIQFSYPGKDYDDLMAGVDAALAKGFIDPNNLFVCGGSGGGLLTAWIVGHTNRFAAAVAMRPVIDWVSFVGVTDGAAWYRQFEKYPWEDPADHLARSPLKYVANVVTPTMVMTGEADLRTPIGQSEEFYRALKLLKKDTLLVRMPEEFHGWRRPSHQLLQQLYLLAWFEKHKRPGAAAATDSR